MEIKTLEWNAFIKLLDEGNFDAVALAWSGAAVDHDPKQIWHSSSATKGGSNFVGYSNPKVDKMIDEAREEMDKKKRIQLMREIYKMIAEDAPYAFLFNEQYALYGHTSRMKMPKPTFNYTVGTSYWWVTE
jgi:peptide/nickel transport system substrate-binding protein/microcin C transport system substrate-binding protein